MTGSGGTWLRLLAVLAAALSLAVDSAVGSTASSSGSPAASQAADGAAQLISGNEHGGAADQMHSQHKRRHYKGAHGEDNDSGGGSGSSADCASCWPDRWMTAAMAAPVSAVRKAA
jgi:hypothetical protein